MRKIGYTWLKDHFNLEVAPLTHESSVGSRRRIEWQAQLNCVFESFSRNYLPPDDSPLGHLEFALKYDDLHLDLFGKVFKRIDPLEIAAYIDARPTGKYCRQIGFLYEFLTGETLTLGKPIAGNYVDLLDSQKYIAAVTPRKNQRWLINDNLLGDRNFCPVVRRSAFIAQQSAVDFTGRLSTFQNDIEADLFRRALDYLYFKESKSSYGIEREVATPDREARFVEALKQAGSPRRGEALSEENLAALQAIIVEPRFAHAHFRTWQNYVGQQMPGYTQRIHYVCPPDQFVRSLMAGLAECSRKTAGVHPLVRAAVIAFGFLFIHPYEDGNGRLHRFLIHDTLAHDKFVPEGMILPVSATMLHHAADYDAVLEDFSRPLSRMVRYTLGEDAELTVTNPEVVEGYYRYPDLTPQLEYLFRAVEETINTELIGEVQFLQRYDASRKEIRSIVDLPDRRLDLLIKLLHQNHGNLSRAKRLQFAELTDDEVQRIESACQAIMSS